MNFPFKLKYFLSHLIISCCIALLSLLLILKFWYPDPLHIALGVSSITLMMIAIDVILGPILTFVLAKEGKKGLFFDLMIIATIQLLALLYGMYNIEQARPVWIAFDLNRFELVQKYSVSREEHEKTADEYISEPLLYPQIVAVRIAKNSKEQSDWLMYEMEKSIAPGMRPVLYEPIDDAMDRVLKEKLPIITLNKFNDKQIISEILSKHPNADGFLPLRTNNLGMTVLVNSKFKKIIAIVDLRPW